MADAVRASAASTSSTRRATWPGRDHRHPPAPTQRRCSTTWRPGPRGSARASSAPRHPNFVANRIGVFSIPAVMHHTQRFELGFDVVDAPDRPEDRPPEERHLPHRRRGRLDTLAHVCGTMDGTLPDDPGTPFQGARPGSKALIAGALGQKTRGGIYRKRSATDHGARPGPAGLPPQRRGGAEVAAILKKNRTRGRPVRPAARQRSTRRRSSCGRSSATFSTTAPSTSPSPTTPAISTWPCAGVSAGRWAARDLAGPPAGGHRRGGEGRHRRPGDERCAPLPAWVFEREGAHAAGFYVAADAPQGRAALPGRRQLYPEQVIGEARPTRAKPCWRTQGALSGVPASTPRIGIVSFKSKMHAIGDEVVDGMLEAGARRARARRPGDLAERPSRWAPTSPRSPRAQGRQFDLLERPSPKFQQHLDGDLKHAAVPVVAAVQGMALGGGCEFAMHASHRVMALESYVGLVEAGVG